MKRNWSSLTKEQKQVLMLICFGATVVCVLLYQFVLIPFFESAELRQKQTAKLRTDLAKADLALKQQVRTHAESIALRQRLADLSQTDVPAYGNAFAWATERLYRVAKEAGVDLEGLSGSSQPATVGGRTFTSFSAQMTLQCGYADLLRFLRLLEEQNPLVTVTTLTMDGRDLTPTRHQVSLALEWPAWAQPPAGAGGKQAQP